MPLPPENKTITLIDPRNFYLSKTASEAVSIDKLHEQNDIDQARIEARNVLMQEAADKGADITKQVNP